jgi:uncharacterized membrane protein
MAKVQAAVDVHVPVPTAYDQWTQFEEFPRFMTGVEEVRQLDDTTLHWVAEVSGQRHEWVAEIVEQRPDEVIAWRSTERDGPIGRVTFQPIDSGTRVSIELTYEPEGIKESLGSFLGLDESQVEEDLDRFKELIESREVPTGAWRGRVESAQVVADDPSRS